MSINEKEYNLLVNKMYAEYLRDENFFSDYLDETYSIAEVFAMTQEKKDEVWEDFKAYCVEAVESDIEEEYGLDESWM